VRIWSQNNLRVEAILDHDGALTIAGHDLNGWLDRDEYEYRITVPAAEVPRVVVALGGRAHDDVLALLGAHAEQIVRSGERTWLTKHGIEHRFSSY